MSTGAFGETRENAQSSVYRCTQCRGELQYDAALQGLRCLHCRHTKKIESRDGEIKKYDLQRGLQSLQSRGYGVPLRTSKCGECGALVHFGDTYTATRCAFCGSPQVLEQEAARQVVQPESLIPFRIDRQAAARAVAAWLRGMWFRPSDLMSKTRLGYLTGIYIPYWAFDARVKSDWTADAGYHYTEKETYYETNSQGESERKEREVQHTRWESASGSRTDQYEDLLVCASAGLPSELLCGMEKFETKLLRPYDPQYLVGWLAEEYSVDLKAGWKLADLRIDQGQRLRCGRDVPGDTHRHLSVKSTISNETFRHVLLPIWVSSYRYRGKIYRFLVNGQTGALAGQPPPYSVAKLALLGLCILVLLGLMLAWPFLLSPLRSVRHTSHPCVDLHFAAGQDRCTLQVAKSAHEQRLIKDKRLFPVAAGERRQDVPAAPLPMHSSSTDRDSTGRKSSG